MSSHVQRKIPKQPHHVKQELCTTRAAYRQGRQLTAVKVYTVNDESCHLLIYGVPSLYLHEEVTRLCRRYGDIRPVEYVDYEDREEYTDVFHVVYKRIQSARFAKKQIDTMNYFGRVLHVFYAPELESLAETREKLITRRKEVAQRISKIKQERLSLKNNPVHSDRATPVEPHEEASNAILAPSSHVSESHSSGFQSTLQFGSKPQPQPAYTITNAAESTADFHKIYGSTTDESTLQVEGNIPVEASTNQEQLSKISHSNPYIMNAPFKLNRSEASHPVKRKSQQPPDKIRNKKNQRSCYEHADMKSSDSNEQSSSKADKCDKTDKVRNTNMGNIVSNASTNVGSNIKLKFIPRQLLQKKKLH